MDFHPLSAIGMMSSNACHGLVSEIHLKTAARQRLFWFTVTLLSSAIICHWVSLSHHGQSLMIYTHALVKKTLEANKPIIDRHRCHETFWFLVGLIQALFAVGCWIVAWKRAERGRSSVIIVLLVGYILSFLMLA